MNHKTKMRHSVANQIDPEIMKGLNEETQFIRSQQRGQRRIKIEKGHSALVRFLPAKLGPRNMWYARIGQHWLNRKGIICPRNTSRDFGGDPDAHCPVCDVVEELNSDSDQRISDIGYQASANPQYRTFCVLLSMDDVDMPMEEILQPYEFALTRSVFDELKGFFIAGGKKSPLSILDYLTGNDFVASRGQKGIRLDKQDSEPIFDPDDKRYKAWIQKIESGIKMPPIKIPTLEMLEAFAEKLSASVDAPSGDDAPRPRSTGRPVRGYRATDDDAPRDNEPVTDDELPPRSKRRAAPEPEAETEVETPRKTRNAPQPPVDDTEDEPVEKPQRRSAPKVAEPQEDDEVEAKPARPAAAKRPATDPDDAGEDDYEPVKAKAPAPKRTVAVDDDDDVTPAPDVDEDPAVDDEPVKKPAPGGAFAPTKNRASAAPAAARPAKPDDDDDLPDDDTDPVPPAKEQLPRRRAEEAEPPPAVAQRGRTSEALRARLNGLSTNKR